MSRRHREGRTWVRKTGRRSRRLRGRGSSRGLGSRVRRPGPGRGVRTRRCARRYAGTRTSRTAPSAARPAPNRARTRPGASEPGCSGTGPGRVGVGAAVARPQVFDGQGDAVVREVQTGQEAPARLPGTGVRDGVRGEFTDGQAQGIGQVGRVRVGPPAGDQPPRRPQPGPGGRGQHPWESGRSGHRPPHGKGMRHHRTRDHGEHDSVPWCYRRVGLGP